MKTIKGPAIFLAQFAGDEAPYNTLEGMAGWAAKHGYVGIQIPSWDRRLFDLKRAAESEAYCDEVKGIAARTGLAITELSTHLQGQLVASHPAFDTLLDGFAPAELAGNAQAKAAWGSSSCFGLRRRAATWA
jgi:sugar phosphate isomerase/epimerase